MFVLFASVMLAGVLAQAPTAWSTTFDVLYEAGSTGALYPNVITIPYLVGSNLTVEVVGTNLTYPFQLCLKQNVAMPPVGYAGWGDVCAVFDFAAPTGVKRALFGSGALRGVGSQAHIEQQSSASASASSASVLARRSLIGAWQGTALVRAGSFFATLVGTTTPAANTTITLRLSGETCATGYGPTCAAPTSLAGGATPLPVSVPARGAELLLFDGSTMNATVGSVTLTFAKSGTAGSGVAWVRWAAPPLDVAGGYDYKLTLGDGATTAVIASPRAGAWFVLLGNTDNTTALTGNVTLLELQCGASGYGAGCAVHPGAVDKPGVVVNHDLAAGASLYLAFDAKTGLALAAAPTDSTAAPPSLYAKLGSVPTTSDFDYSNCNVASCSGQRTLIAPLALEAPAMQADQWFALVVANGAGGVSVWNADACANNCTATANGVCNAATSACACATDFLGFDCATGKNELERWEWALIIGGGVLVAIGLIGCIVYFIQKQQRRKGFERV